MGGGGGLGWRGLGGRGTFFVFFGGRGGGERGVGVFFEISVFAVFWAVFHVFVITPKTKFLQFFAVSVGRAGRAASDSSVLTTFSGLLEGDTRYLQHFPPSAFLLCFCLFVVASGRGRWSLSSACLAFSCRRVSEMSVFTAFMRLGPTEEGLQQQQQQPSCAKPCRAD